MRIFVLAVVSVVFFASSARADCIDADGDGYDSFDAVECQTGTDCDDTTASTHPGAPELCNSGVDDDCAPWTVETDDPDGDTFSICTGDCLPDDPNTYPSAPEACDGVDNDCDGSLPPGEDDADDDPVLGCQGDCDTDDPENYPGNGEVCDGQDNDCNGQADAGTGWFPYDLGSATETLSIEAFAGNIIEVERDSVLLEVRQKVHTPGTGPVAAAFWVAEWDGTAGSWTPIGGSPHVVALLPAATAASSGILDKVELSAGHRYLIGVGVDGSANFELEKRPVDFEQEEFPFTAVGAAVLEAPYLQAPQALAPTESGHTLFVQTLEIRTDAESDLDGDGYRPCIAEWPPDSENWAPNPPVLGGDCDDREPSIHPGAHPELTEGTLRDPQRPDSERALVRPIRRR